MSVFRAFFHHRTHTAAAALAVVLSGMAYTLWWGPLVLHVPVWIVPGDIWGTFRDAHIIGWGGEGILYASDIQPLTGFISLPGMPTLLAPVAMIAGALNLTESLPLALPHPTAWILLGPVEMAVGSAVLFPLSSLAQRLGVPRGRRIPLLWLEAALIWPVVAVWGHPEDLVALGLGVYALIAVQESRWLPAALLLGVALVFQPLIVLLVPLALATTPWRHWISSIALLTIPSLALLVAPLFHAWHTTIHVLVDQPTYPASNHPTPWIALSTVLEPSRRVQGAVVYASSPHSFTVRSASGAIGSVVAGGPVRVVPIVLSCLIAVVARRRTTARDVWFLASLCLALRCVFEAVMTPYYSVPALAVALVVAASSTRVRLALSAVGAAACTYFGYDHAGAWSYYLPVTIALVLAVVVGRPGALIRLFRTAKRSAPDHAAAMVTEGDPCRGLTGRRLTDYVSTTEALAQLKTPLRQ